MSIPDDNRDCDEVAATFALARVLAALRTATTQDAARLRRTERNRINLLKVHATTAIIVPPLFLLSRPFLMGPNWSVIRHIPGFPLSVAAVLWAGGVILLPAAVARVWRFEVLGLALICAWYTMAAVGFSVPAIGWLVSEGVPSWVHGHTADKPQVALYGAGIYAHLATIMAVHLFTLVRMRRDPVARAALPIEVPR